MKITPLAADSMGSRSMSVFVETRNGSILMDPGASVVPLRFGLSPHPLEEWQLQKHIDRIRLFSESAQAIVITSYHSDHFLSDKAEWTKGKVLFIKNPNQNATPSERKSAFHFLKTANRLAAQLHFADGRSFAIGSTEILFSPACFNSQEYFLEVLIRDQQKSFLFSSNVQGPVSEEISGFLLAQKADTLYLDGPVTYLQKSQSKNQTVETVIERMKKIALETGTRQIILDHHLLRDLNWKKIMEPFFQFGSEHGIQIQTAAEFRGEKSTPLEARRNQLYQNQPPR